jgi:hypothetical protein
MAAISAIVPRFASRLHPSIGGHPFSLLGRNDQYKLKRGVLRRSKIKTVLTLNRYSDFKGEARFDAP